MALPKPEGRGPLPVTDCDIRMAAAITFLWDLPKVGSRTVSRMVQSWGNDDPAAYISKLENLDLFWRPRYEQFIERIASIELPWQLVRRGNPVYPSSLEKLDAPPAALFLLGDISLLSRTSFAVVGTRKPSEEGIRRANRLVRHLSSRQFVITSGLAAGVDTAALSAALACNNKTIAVIGTPLDKAYPRENKALQYTIARSGLLVSQYPFFSATERGNFPERNRTMAAISTATCVVEAGPTSGTRHQVECSIKLGHPVYFMRSMIDSGPSPWVLEAIDKGALILDAPDQLGEFI